MTDAEDAGQLARTPVHAAIGLSLNPHWLARGPRSNRLVLRAELGGEKGVYLAVRCGDSRLGWFGEKPPQLLVPIGDGHSQP